MIWGGVLNSSYLILFKTAYEIQPAVFTWNCCVLFVIVVPLNLSDLRIEINSVRKNSHLQKLVVKPDQLIKRRGKLGLIKVNTDLAGVKAWVGERMGTEVQVRASSYSVTGHRSVLVWRVRHRGFIGIFFTREQIFIPDGATADITPEIFKMASHAPIMQSNIDWFSQTVVWLCRENRPDSRLANPVSKSQT